MIIMHNYTILIYESKDVYAYFKHTSQYSTFIVEPFLSMDSRLKVVKALSSNLSWLLDAMKVGSSFKASELKDISYII